jgi:hypothetical protein
MRLFGLYFVFYLLFFFTDSTSLLFFLHSIFFNGSCFRVGVCSGSAPAATAVSPAESIKKLRNTVEMLEKREV